MSIKSIPTNAFKSQSTITSVKFGSKCSYVGINAFKDCISLKEINDDNSIEKIERGTFAGTNLYSVIFNNLSTIGASSFDKCSNLTYVNATNCQKVGNYAFQKCSNLQQIDIQSCNNIGMYAFNMCNNLKSVNINTSVEINKCAFYGCINLSDIDFKNCNKIGNEAFYMCSNIKNANLTNCIKGIGSSAFAGCDSLEQITLSQTTIGDCAFLNCNNLNKVYIQTKKLEKCIELGNSVFYNYVKTGPMTYNYEIISNIKFYLDVDIIRKYERHSVWSMYSSHFVKLPSPYQIVYTTNNNSIIQNQNIDDNINIDSHTYDNTGNYGIITFKNKITSFNQQFFKGENTLTSVELPSYCVEIGNNEFEDCKNLNSFTQQSNNLTKIGDYAFKNCESLKSFDIPETITDLGEGIFAGCSNIEKFEGKFISYDGKAVVYKNTLVCVLPKDDNDTEGRYYNISDIDSTITKLGKSCFYGCKELRRVDISSNIGEIGDNAFEGCENLREVHMGSIVPKIGSNVFGKKIHKDFKILVPENNYVAYCTKWANSGYKEYIYPKPNNNSIIYYSDEKLTSDSLETSYNNFTNGKYYKISNIKNVLSSNYFSEKSVKKVILGEDITELNNSAFKKCTDLEYIHIPDSITKIGDGCFYCCESLKSINIPNKYSYTYTIEFDTGDSESEKLKCSKGKTVFGNEIFYGCKNLEEFISYYSIFVSSDGRCYIDNGELNFFAYGGITSYNIPNKVIKINRSAFRGSDITNINLNERIKNIGEYAFAECKSLSSIDKWDNVETISKCAFMNCGIGTISLPVNLKTIDEMAFEECKTMKLKNNTVLKNVTTIGKSAFKNCGISGSLELNNIQSINESVFSGCLKLTSVSINDNVEIIDTDAFYNCTNLSSIKINKSSNLKSINNRAFWNCTNLTELYIPDSVEYLGSRTFEDCLNYKGTNNVLTLPDNLTAIGSYCFKNSGIATLNILENCELTSISTEAFSNCRALTTIDISKSTKLKSIATNAFYNSSKLNKLSLSDTITSIGDNAFNNCKELSEILIPTSISKLGHYCFATNASEININMKNLLMVNPPTFTKSGINDVDSYPFGDIDGENVLNLYFPTTTNTTIINKYRTNDYWKKYKDFIKQNTTVLPGGIQ